MKARAILAALLLLPPGTGFGYTSSHSSSAEFLRSGIGARPVAMGNSSLGATGAEPLSWNPALLGRTRERSFSLMYGALLEESSYQQIAYAHPLGAFGTLGAAFHFQTLGKIAATDEDDQDIGI